MKAQFPEGTEEKLEKAIREECDGRTLRKMQVILLGAKGIPASMISLMTEYKEGYIRELWMKYRKKGEAIFLSGNTRTRNNAYLSWEEEEAFLTPFLEKAKGAGILIVSDIHTSLQQRLEVSIPVSTIYTLLHRHGWRKIVPRSYHSKRNSEKREA